MKHLEILHFSSETVVVVFHYAVLVPPCVQTQTCIHENLQSLIKKLIVWGFFSDITNSDSESFNPSVWEEQRKHRAQVAFECDEDKDERETPPRVCAKFPLMCTYNIKRGIDIEHFNISLLCCYFCFLQEGNLKRYPTPYPDELKNMVKTAQSVAHRLKEDESSDESGKPNERNHIGVQDVGVKVSFTK